MLFTIEQIAALKMIVTDYHTAFAINTYGPQTVPPTVVARLRELGLIDYTVNKAEEAYLFGVLVQQLNNPAIASLPYEQLKRYLKKNPVPLSNIEKQAVEIAASRGAQFVVGLGNRVAQDTGQVLVEADAALRLKLQNDIKTTVSQGIDQRESVKEIKSNMGHAMVDWSRDLDRIAATETSRAMNDGMAAEVRAQNGAGAEVAVMSRQGCCEECQGAYTGPDGAPFIFLLTDLEANGTNYKRNKQQRKAVVPPYHPNCACSLVQVDKNDGFDADGDLVPMGKLGIRPHAKAIKSMVAGLKTLIKSDAPGYIDWFGIRITGFAPAGSGQQRATVHAGGTGFDGLIGPQPLAMNAFVAHQPLRDVVLLGFNQLEDAALALRNVEGSGGQGVPSDWSTVPVHELAKWSAAPKQSLTIAKARPTGPLQPRQQALIDSRVLILQTRPHIRPKVVDPAESLSDAPPLDGMPQIRVAKTPRRSPFAMQPNPHHIEQTIHSLVQPTEKDEREEMQIRLAARQVARRKPVIDLKD